MSALTILPGDCRQTLATLPAESVQCCVASPPYYGLRDYGCAGQIGLEQTPEAFVAEMVGVFREVRRVLREDGTLWLNLGDSYTGSGKGGNPGAGKQSTNRGSQSVGCLYETGKSARDAAVTNVTRRNFDLGPKQLLGIPWRVAFALQADGWILRQWHPWVKRNPMPESTRDRPSSGVETVFLLAKSPSYFYDYEAVKRTMAPASVNRLAQNVEAQKGSERANGGAKTNGAMKAVGGDKQRGHSRRHAGFNERWDRMEREEQCQSRAFRNTDFFVQSIDGPAGAIGNDRELIAFDVATRPFRGAHFATFPPALIEPCILAGSRGGDTVLDPFGGSGTTGMVARQHGRNAILCELNPAYCDLIRRRCDVTPGFAFTEEAA